MGARVWIVIAALLGASGVAMGAFHSHGLERMLDAQELAAEVKASRMENCGTAVRYQLLHTLAMLTVASMIWHRRSRMLHATAGLWLAGVLGFTWPLYAYAITGSKLMIHVVPMGGVTMIAGWLMLAASAMLLQPPRAT